MLAITKGWEDELTMTWKQKMFGVAMAIATFAVLALGAGADWYG